MVKAIQEQQAQIETLQKQVDKLIQMNRMLLEEKNYPEKIK